MTSDTGHSLNLGARADRTLLTRSVVGVMVGVVLGISVLAVSFLPSMWAPLAILAIIFPFLAMIVGDARRLLLAMVLLDIPISLDIHLGNRDEALAFGAIGGLGISVTTVALVGLYAIWIGELLGRRRRASLPLLRPSLPLGMYTFFVMASMAVATDVELSFYEVFILLQTLLLFIYVVANIRSRKDVSFVVIILVTGLLLESLVILALGFVGQSFNLSGFTGRILAASPATGGLARPAGTLASPNVAGSYLGFVVTIALSVLIAQGERWHRVLAGFAFILGAIALVLTLSRGAWAALIVSLGVLCFFAWRSGRLPMSLAFAIALMSVIGVVLFWDPIAVRLFGEDQGAAISRVSLMMLALRIIRDNPVFGVGANNIGMVIPKYATGVFSNAFLYAVHNKFLLVWAETGLGGLTAFLWFLVITLRKAWRCWSFKDGFMSPLALGLFAAILGQMVHMQVDLFRGRGQVQLLWLAAGLVAALDRLVEERVRANWPASI